VQHAQLIRGEGQEQTLQMFVDQDMDALSGLRPFLTNFAPRIAGSRILDGRFTTIQQAIGTPAARGAGAAYLREFVEDAKRSGLVGQLIARHQVRGLSVAPLAAVG
ncbi:MAG: ABC transporter substrate-binding protein, partial [Betaproteobacteria bacterium]